VYNPNITNECVTGYSMLSTVADQKQLFSRCELQAADDARELYRKIGRPDEAEFELILRKNLIRNCPVTPYDAKPALVIYGPDIAVIKGKTTCEAAAPTFEAMPLPPPILAHHRNVTLCVDFFVKGIPFYHTISRGVGFRTVQQVPDRGWPSSSARQKPSSSCTSLGVSMSATPASMASLSNASPNCCSNTWSMTPCVA
jgi:hypothetical protein